MKHSEYLCTHFAFGHLAANVRVRSSNFSNVICLFCIFEWSSAIFVWQALLRNFATVMANMIEEMLGTREAEATAVATESGGEVATESGGAVATESGGDRDGDETGDETGGPRDETGYKTAATAGDERDDGDR